MELSVKQLIELSKNSISESYIYKAISVSRAKGRKSWQTVEEKGELLIKYDSIPTPTKSKLPELGQIRATVRSDKVSNVDKEKLDAISNLQNRLVSNNDDLKFYLKYFEFEKSIHYARACEWLRLLLEFKGKKAIKKIGFYDKNDLRTAVLQYLKEEQNEALKNVTSIQTLQRKEIAFNKKGYKTLLDGNTGKKNGQKLTQDAEDFILFTYSDHRKFSIEETTRIYNKACYNESLPLFGNKTVTSQTIKTFLFHPSQKQIWYAPRHGKSFARNEFEMVIKRKRASFGGAMWVLDGSPLELHYKKCKKTTDKNGKTKNIWTTGRKYIFAAIDAHSEAILGYSISETETIETVKDCLRKAVRQTNTFPIQLQYDNSSALKSGQIQSVMKAISRYNTPASVGNARAKIIESFFHRFCTEVLKYEHNFSGGNITTKKIDSKDNREWIKDNFDLLPTELELDEQIEKAVIQWNYEKKEGHEITRYENFAKDKEKQRPFDAKLYREAFFFWGKDTKHGRGEYKYTNDGITIQYQNEKYSFISYDASLNSRILHGNYQVRFDPNSLGNDDSLLWLYKNDVPFTIDEQHVALAKAPEQPMAIVDYTEGSRQELENIWKAQKEQMLLVDEMRVSRIDNVPDNMKIIQKSNIQKDYLNAIEDAQKTITIGQDSKINYSNNLLFNFQNDSDDDDELEIAG
ncbi:transposase family protein [Bernardetia sp. Wsw4-3y2]|uniref:integrase catalytic domain-containing protein n=1 Tax=Bernardetia sp. Wsw4-3y2 TaxID=3127471 RepID=UPI0030CE9D81